MSTIDWYKIITDPNLAEPGILAIRLDALSAAEEVTAGHSVLLGSEADLIDYARAHHRPIAVHKRISPTDRALYVPHHRPRAAFALAS